MRKLLISIILSAIPFVCFAGGDSIKLVVEDNSSASTNSITSKKISGYVESINIDVTAPATQTVVVASGDTTILTASAVTADAIYRVRFPASDATGTAVGGTTNISHLLVNEAVTVTVTSTQTNVLDTGVLIKMYNVK